MDTFLENKQDRKRKGWMYFAAFSSIFIMTYVMFQKQAQLTVSSDIVTHMKYILSLDQVLKLTHCGWHFICWLFYACLPITPAQAAVLVTSLFNGIFAVLVAWLADQYLIQGTQAGKSGKKMAYLPAMISFVACTVGPLYLRFYNANYYKGQGTANVWHNPTVIAVRPIMIVIDVLALGYWEWRKEEKTGEERKAWKKKLRRYQYLLTVLLAISTLIKPSFLMVYLPVCAIAELWRLIKEKQGLKAWGDAIKKNLYFLPSLLIFLWQYLKIYIIGGEASGEGGIAIAFFKVARSYAPSVVISLGLKMAFPVLVIFIWRKKIFKERMFPLIFSQFVMGLLISWTFTETGRRAAHGNFGWGNVLAASFLWVFCLIFYFREMLEDQQKLRTDQKCRWKYGIPFLFLVWHLLAGLCYYWELLHDMGRQL